MVIHCRLFLQICQGVCWVIDRITLLVAKLLVPPRYFTLGDMQRLTLRI